MTTKDIKTEFYNEVAYEFANTLIGNGRSILQDRDDNPDRTDAFHTITANCSGRILKIINGKTIYPNWFLDPTKIPSTGKCSTSHFIFRKVMYDVLKDKIGEDHKIFINYVVVNKEEKIFSIQFFHNRKKEPEPLVDTTWISHSTGSDNNTSAFIKHNSTPVKKNYVPKNKKYNK
jgi:hypothetical protein